MSAEVEPMMLRTFIRYGGGRTTKMRSDAIGGITEKQLDPEVDTNKIFDASAGQLTDAISICGLIGFISDKEELWPTAEFIEKHNETLGKDYDFVISKNKIIILSEQSKSEKIYEIILSLIDLACKIDR